MGAELLEEFGAEGEVGGAESEGAESVEGVAEEMFERRVGEEAEEADGEIGEEVERMVAEESEGEDGEEPEEEEGRAD